MSTKFIAGSLLYLLTSFAYSEVIDQKKQASEALLSSIIAVNRGLWTISANLESTSPLRQIANIFESICQNQTNLSRKEQKLLSSLRKTSRNILEADKDRAIKLVYLKVFREINLLQQNNRNSVTTEIIKTIARSFYSHHKDILILLKSEKKDPLMKFLYKKLKHAFHRYKKYAKMP